MPRKVMSEARSAELAAAARASIGHSVHRCISCADTLPPSDHLRVNLANPHQSWRSLRFCDLVCLLRWADRESDACGAGEVFTRVEWVDRTAAVPSGRVETP